MTTGISQSGTGAVRSDGVVKERWDLASYPAISELLLPMRKFRCFDLHPQELIAKAAHATGLFLSGTRNQLDDAFCYLAVGIQKLDCSTEQYATWVERVRSYQREDSCLSTFQYAPYHCLRRMAETYHEGACKYGMHNWLNGFQVTDLMNHSQKHLIKWLNGLSEEGWIPGTLEDDLGHAAWGYVASRHMLLYRPDMCKFLLDPCFGITPEIHSAFPFKKREPMLPPTEKFPGSEILSTVVKVRPVKNKGPKAFA